MKLADKPCYPCEIEYNSARGYGKEYVKHYGLTFKERLVIALASGVGTIIRSEGYEQEIADGIIRQADAIIAELEKEK